MPSKRGCHARIFTSPLQSATAAQNGRTGGRPVECESKRHGSWPKVVRWREGKSVRICPVCNADPPTVATLESHWCQRHPDSWKGFLLAGVPLESISFEIRRAAQRCFEKNSAAEQSAFDASVLDQICQSLGYSLSDFQS